MSHAINDLKEIEYIYICIFPMYFWKLFKTAHAMDPLKRSKLSNNNHNVCNFKSYNFQFSKKIWTLRMSKINEDLNSSFNYIPIVIDTPRCR